MVVSKQAKMSIIQNLSEEPMHKTLAILTCYHHPEWTQEAIDSLVPQACDVVVVDNRDWNAPQITWNGVRDVFRYQIDQGPPCRFTPAFALFQDYEWILFADEDLRLTVDCIEKLEDAGAAADRKFATIGVVGRRHGSDDGHAAYVRRNIKRQQGQTVRVDMTARLHFIDAVSMVMVARLKAHLREHAAPIGLLGEDDLLLCHATQTFARLPSLLLPAETTITCGNRGGRRRDGTAYSAKAGFISNRTALIQQCQKLGWRSLCNEV